MQNYNNDERRTIADLVSQYITRPLGNCLESSLEFVANNRAGCGIAAAVTLIYAANYGVNHYADYLISSNYNFVKPGADVEWENNQIMWGAFVSGVNYYIKNWYYNLGAIAAGGILEAAVKKIGSIRVS